MALGIAPTIGVWRIQQDRVRICLRRAAPSTATISRYSVYQYEMNYITDRSPGAEIGDPQCNPLGIKYRRVLNAAIINCGSNPEVISNNARDVPVAGFGKFFLTVPAASGPSLYAEFLGLIKPTDNLNHDKVQLYR